MTWYGERWRPQLRVGGVSVDLKFLIVIVMGTLLPMFVMYNHKITGVWEYDQFLCFFVIPVAVIILGFLENPLKFGLGIGKWREGLIWILIVCPIMAIILWYVARRPDMAKYYLQYRADTTARTLWLASVELWGWEYIWRGFWLFGLARVIGPGPAILIQAVPFSFLHIGKPEVETLSTIFGGTGFGFVAWRCQSFLYGWFIHVFMLAITIFLAIWVAG